MSSSFDETAQEPAPELARDAAEPTRKSPWTEWKREELKRLYLLGWSASKIARELGIPTRNAVIGQQNRMGLSRRYHEHPNANKPGPARLPKPRSEGVPMRRPMALDAELAKTVPTFTDRASVSFAELDEPHCRWPGELPDGQMGYCGCQRVPGKSYCAGHLAKSEVAVQPKPITDPTSRRPPQYRSLHAVELQRLGVVGR